MAAIVTAERLSKTFRVKVRDPGLQGALAALVRPRYRDVHAVRDVTFRIEPGEIVAFLGPNGAGKDRKSTRLNSSHLVISYAVFCLKKKKNIQFSNSQHIYYNYVIRFEIL